MTLSPQEIVPLLLAACPTADTSWKEHLAWWSPEEPGHFNNVSVFAHHVVDSYASGSTAEFPAFFAAVERIAVEGTPEAIDLATSLLEDIQNIASHRPFGGVVFEPWLGPAGRRQWAVVAAMWEGKHSLMDVIRAEAAKQK